MELYDAILCPVCSFAGMVLGTTDERLPSFSYTMTYNLTGWHTVVVRSGTAAEQLPAGVQIVAHPCHEHVALAIARQLGKALVGWQPSPI